ncbi:potassium transporter TrkA [Haloprofundus marisrubri]|uniref:Potassium transporter TrkA n=1 Tax=Haloprofundus marisrubri TaxID=1514971 RepID=A0A0W1R7G1_9EURY|nr:NAD-binding protein [Haloprofundus marisrubri]KTG09355.1 potassium transporter TrkA [Haloprofundus marisrubri]
MRELRNVRGLHPRDLTGRQRLLVVYVIGLISVVFVFTLLYSWGMATFENRPRTLLHSLNKVVETLTTTGYGADSPWQSPEMTVLVITMQISGIVIGFITLRVLVIPLYERSPLNLDDRLSIKNDHVVVAEYRRDTEVLLDELEELDVDYVLVESDREEAKQLSDDGYQAIHGDPEDGDDLERASIEKASTLITDAGDRTASVVLTALEANEDLRVISFTASVRRKAAFAEIGVDRSVAPHALIGRRLAEKATTPVTVDSDLDDTSVAIREVLVRRGSSLHGVQIADSPLVAHPNLTLVAGWFDGELRVPPSPTDRLTPNTVLVIAGPEHTLDEAAKEVSGVRNPRDSSHDRIVVAGLGEGGTAAVETLPEHVSVTTIDQSGGADVVGDVTEPGTLEAADIGHASALIVTVDDDATALLAVAMARSLASDIEILTRVTETEKTAQAFRAGTDYVLSVQQLCARLVAAEVHGERVMDPVGQIRLVRADASAFSGETLQDVRRETDRGWTVVGVARDGGVRTDEETVIESDDEMFVAGSDEAIQQFEQTVDTA